MPLSLLKEPHFITVVFPDKQERPEEQGPHPTQGGRFSLRSVFGVGEISQPGHFLSSGNILTPAHIQIVRGPLTFAENGSASTPGVVTISWSLGETAGELPASTRVLRADCVRLPWDAPTPWTGLDSGQRRCFGGLRSFHTSAWSASGRRKRVSRRETSGLRAIHSELRAFT